MVDMLLLFKPISIQPKMNCGPPRFAYSVTEIPLTQFEPSFINPKGHYYEHPNNNNSSILLSPIKKSSISDLMLFNHNNNNNDSADQNVSVIIQQKRWVDLNIHTHIVLGGYAACLTSFAFCIGIVLLPPGPTLKAGGPLRYISEGLDVFCGWSAVIMGTCTMLILMCQLIASSYMRDGRAAFFALLQAFAWNVVAGVSNTGWFAHYVALVVFLVSNLMFNRIASLDPSYGFFFFKVANASSLLFSILFIGIGLCAMIYGIDSAEGATMRSFAVALEFVVMFTIVLQTTCLIQALDSFHTIHLRFIHR